MNETAHTFNLGSFLLDKQGWGRAAGVRIQHMLQDYLEARPAVGLFRLSMQGMSGLT